MATSLYKAQAALRLCDQRDHKELNYYCRTCGKTICTKCVKSEHKSHDWELISEYLKERRRQLPTECGDLQSKELVDLQQKIDRFETKLRENKKELERNECLIENERKNVMGGINQFFNEELNKCRQFTDDKNTIIEKERDELKKKRDYLQMITNSLMDISTFSDHDVIEMEGQMKAELDSAEKFDAEKHTGCSIFIPGDMEKVSSNLCEVHTFSLEEITSCVPLNTVVAVIAPVPSERAAWVRDAEDKNYYLLSEEGEKQKSLANSGDCLVVRTDGKILLLQNQLITVLDDNEKILDQTDMSPFYPQYIALTKEEDILITLVDGGDAFELDITSRRIVRHMTISGKVLHTYEFRDNNKKVRLFKSPRRIAENKNTDLCIINRVSSEKAELIVLEREGRMKFCFKGTGEFDPWDVVCDSKCRILLGETHSQSIIVLNSEGIQLSILHTFNDIPLTMALKDERLWCGFSEGSITVYKYK